MECTNTCHLQNAIIRLKNNDSNLICIETFNRPVKNTDVLELIECLSTIPHTVVFIGMSVGELTDIEGIALARFIAFDSTVTQLYLGWNKFEYQSFVSFAQALYVNKSLIELSLYNDNDIPQNTIEKLFANALRLNPARKDNSYWHLFAYTNSFLSLREIAEKSTSPSMLEFLLYCHSRI